MSHVTSPRLYGVWDWKSWQNTSRLYRLTCLDIVKMDIRSSTICAIKIHKWNIRPERCRLQPLGRSCKEFIGVSAPYICQRKLCYLTCSSPCVCLSVRHNLPAWLISYRLLFKWNFVDWEGMTKWNENANQILGMIWVIVNLRRNSLSDHVLSMLGIKSC